MLDTDCTRNSMAFTKHVPASMCTFNRGIKPTKCLMKCTEIISHHVQDAQEGEELLPQIQALERKEPCRAQFRDARCGFPRCSEVPYLLTLLGMKLRSSLKQQAMKTLWSEANRYNILSSILSLLTAEDLSWGKWRVAWQQQKGH